MAGPRLFVLGNVNLDLGVGPVAAWPQPGTEVLGRLAFYRPGGSAGNAALAFASLGYPVQLHAELGGDPLGKWLAAELQEAGVDCTHVRFCALPTAFSFSVSHPGGERTFFSFAGHLQSQGLSGERQILEAPPGSVVLACGYYLLPRWRDGSLARFFGACRAQGIVTCLDVGWPPDGRFDLDELTPVLEHTYLFLPNRAEALALTGEETLQGALARLAQHVAVTVVKDGANGAWALDGTGRHGAVGRVAHRPTRAVAPEDTIGAGDAFNAALVAALFFEGLPLDRALDYANAAAGLAIMSRPRRYPSAAEVRARLAEGAARVAGEV